MQCPNCRYEPRDRLMHKPCPECGHTWVDTESYVTLLASGLPIQSALDIGCGNKGVIAQHFWENVQPISQGYACDRHVIKELPPLWRPLLMDAEGLERELGEGGVDFVTHCGMLEHVEYDKALRILEVIERIAKVGFFSSCSSVCREVDYKVKVDGNPFHYYRSFWNPEVFEALGYAVDRQRMLRGETFIEEIPFWFIAGGPKLRPWGERVGKAIDILCARRCYAAGCNHEPVGWSPYVYEGEKLEKQRIVTTEPEAYGGCFCFEHAPIHEHTDKRKKTDPHRLGAQIKRWLQNPALLEQFPVPPWRRERLEL